MFKNYFKTAIRSLWKNKVTSLINLFGLAIGMTATVFIFLWVGNEMSFNNYHPGKENIYRVTNSIQVSNNEAWVWETSPMLMAETAMKEVPEIKNATRLMLNTWDGTVLSINSQTIF